MAKTEQNKTKKNLHEEVKGKFQMGAIFSHPVCSIVTVA